MICKLLKVFDSFPLTEEAPSTASSTPDSTEGKSRIGERVGFEGVHHRAIEVLLREAHHPPWSAAGGNDDSDFRELHTAREFSEDEEDEEETTSQDWGTPRELTFSYIAFDGVVGSGGRRDSAARRPRPQGRSVSEPRDLPPQPGLGDSLESIPSLSQSPEPGRHGDPDTAPQAERSLEDLRLRLDQLGWAGSGEDSATSSSTPLEDEEPEGLEVGEAGEGEPVLACKPQEWVVFPWAPPGRKLMAFCLYYFRTRLTTTTCSVVTAPGLDSSAQPRLWDPPVPYPVPTCIPRFELCA
jgi:hypothetical protein